jgi:hypothetical protein
VPNKTKFSHTLGLLGSDSRAPVFVSVPRTGVALGQTYQYPLQAMDPDGHAV